MDALPFIQEIGRGRESARGLRYEDAVRMFDAIFGGGVGDVELGAILVALRMKGESLDELRAGSHVLEPLLRRVPVDATRPAVSIPSYHGARRTANLVPLLACLLADAGVQVVVHGVVADPERTTTADVMQAMGLGPAADPTAAEAALDRGDPAFVPVASLSPPLASLLELRRRLGLRNVGHSLAMLVNPTDSPACLRIASYTHPDRARLQHAFFERTRVPALVMPGTEGEAVASLRRGTRIDWVHDGCTEVLVPAGPEPAHAPPALPDPRDAPATARWIQSALAGERPVPPQVERQVAAVLQALGVHPRSRVAEPA